MDTMLTDLESAINCLIDVYHKYSLNQGNYHAVYRDDLKKLLETECPKFMKVRRDWVWFGVLGLDLMKPWVIDHLRCSKQTAMPQLP